MKRAIIVGTNTLLQMAKQLMQRGEITPSQYSTMENRNEMLIQEQRETVVVLG